MHAAFVLLLLGALAAASSTVHGGMTMDMETEGLASAAAPRTLYITGLTNHDAPPYLARVQCWALNDTFTTYPTVGRSLPLGDVSNITYVVLPLGSAEGWHRPPHAMWFVLVSGMAKVYVPRTNDARHSIIVQRSLDLNDGITDPERGRKGPSEPDPDDPAWTVVPITVGGSNQILIAADTDPRAKGHLTFYPGETQTVALQIPFGEGRMPPYRVVHEGACTRTE